MQRPENTIIIQNLLNLINILNFLILVNFIMDKKMDHLVIELLYLVNDGLGLLFYGDMDDDLCF